jgi:hypothetical protein
MGSLSVYARAFRLSSKGTHEKRREYQGGATAWDTKEFWGTSNLRPPRVWASAYSAGEVLVQFGMRTVSITWITPLD